MEIKGTHPRHAAVDDEVGPVDEAALVAGEEQDGVGLLDSFAEAAGGEVDLAAVPLGGVVAEPVLQEGRAGGGGLDDLVVGRRRWGVGELTLEERGTGH